MESLEKRLAIYRELSVRRSAESFGAYLDAVTIDSRPDPAPFRVVARDWQRARYERVRGALEDVTGIRTGYTGPRRFWETMARGHDKTTGFGRAANWVLAFSKRKLTILAAAADRDQAALLTEAMRKEAELNPWFQKRLAFQRDRVIGPGGVLKLMTSDAPSAAGERGDIIICDEVTHWENRSLWDMLYSGINKMPGAIFWVITNAGLLNSWQWEELQKIKGMSNWLVYEAPGMLNSWMSASDIEQDRKLLLPSEARRLLDNVWIDPAEESGYLTRPECQACEEYGRELGIYYGHPAEDGCEYWAGIDYGPKRDRTALSVLHQRTSGLLVVDRLDVWQGSPSAPVPIQAIYDWVEDRRKEYPTLALVVDPYQLEELVQHYQRHLLVERFEGRGGKANYELAECIRSLIVNQQLAWYPQAGLLPLKDGTKETLIDEIASLVIKRMVYGYRIDHETTKHDDRTIAIGMPAVTILNRMRSGKFKRPPQVNKQEDPNPLKLRIHAAKRHIYGM